MLSKNLRYQQAPPLLYLIPGPFSCHSLPFFCQSRPLFLSFPRKRESTLQKQASANSEKNQTVAVQDLTLFMLAVSFPNTGFLYSMDSRFRGNDEKKMGMKKDDGNDSTGNSRTALTKTSVFIFG